MLARLRSRGEELLVRYPWLRPYVLKLTRFGGVGLFNSALYAVISIACIRLFGIGPTMASVIAYLGCVPVAFWAHKRITFRSQAKAEGEFLRFVVAQVLSFGIAVGGMHASVQILGLHYLIGVFSAVFLVPLATFFVLDQWVFAKPKI